MWHNTDKYYNFKEVLLKNKYMSGKYSCDIKFEDTLFYSKIA